MIETVAGAIGGMRVVNQVEVEPPVVVEIEERCARANGFVEQKTSRRIRLMHKVHASGDGEIFKPVRVRARVRRRFGGRRLLPAARAQHERQQAQAQPAAKLLAEIIQRAHA